YYPRTDIFSYLKVQKFRIVQEVRLLSKMGAEICRCGDAGGSKLSDDVLPRSMMTAWQQCRHELIRMPRPIHHLKAEFRELPPISLRQLLALFDHGAEAFQFLFSKERPDFGELAVEPW